jgi:hypothetical protein
MLFKPVLDSRKGADLHAVQKLSSTQERGAMFRLFKSESGSVFQVGVSPTIDSVSPLSLWERARVRGFWRYAQATLLTSNFEPENRWSFIDWASKVAAGL